MNDFFNTNNTNTYTVRTTKGDFTFTAIDIAKMNLPNLGGGA